MNEEQRKQSIDKIVKAFEGMLFSYTGVGPVVEALTNPPPDSECLAMALTNALVRWPGAASYRACRTGSRLLQSCF